MSKEIKKPQKKATNIPIQWHIPEGLNTPFASNMLVQMIENEFKLSFFEIKPPIITDESQPQPESIRADYIGGVIVTADRLPKFIKVLQQQLDKYNEKQSKQKK